MERRTKNLSFSSYSTYVTCGWKWFLENVERLTQEYEPSHFLFGRVVDTGITVLLETKGDLAKAMLAVIAALSEIHSTKITFDPRDYDGELIHGKDLAAMIKRIRVKGWPGDDPNSLANELFDIVERGAKLSVNQEFALKELVKETFYQKAKLMVESFNKHIMPQIEELYSTQENVKRGILDIRARFKGYGDYIADVKTTSSLRYYPKDAASHSVQMIGYGAEKAMYIVFDKTIKKNKQKLCSTCGNDGSGKAHKTCDAVNDDGKRCHGEWNISVLPEVTPHIVTGDIPQRSRDIVEEAYAAAEAGIEKQVFPRNLTACANQYGKPCPFIKLCWENDSKGLTKKRERRNAKPNL